MTLSSLSDKVFITPGVDRSTHSKKEASNSAPVPRLDSTALATLSWRLGTTCLSACELVIKRATVYRLHPFLPFSGP